MRYFSKAMLVALAALCLNLSAYPRDISLKINNVTVKEAMERVKKDTGYSFVFSSKDVNTSQRVSVSVSGASIEEVINQILKGQQGLDYEIQGKKIVLRRATSASSSASQDKKKVSGKVVDANGEPIIGATVKEKGTTNGTITDFDGNFSFNISNGAQIEVSYVGFKTQLLKAVIGKELSVTLKEGTEILDEVVVVGYGTQKKVNLSGAVASVSSKELARKNVTTLGEALQGVVPGLNIDMSTGKANAVASINIRGASSYSGGNFSTGAPLILVDGVEMDMNSLNPEDIESVSVLKDTSSSAIYGARGATGVILITTKKGKAEKPRINYSSNVQFSKPTLIPNLLDSYEYQKAYVEGIELDGRSPSTADLKRLEKVKEYYDNPDTELPYWMEGDVINWRANLDMYDELYRDFATMHKHNVSLSGGSDVTKYYASLSYQGQKDIYDFANDK